MAKPDVRHYLQFNDFSREEYAYVFERARWIKAQFKAYQRYWPLQDRTLVMIFEKASTRTRLSFETGIQQLGGLAIYMNTRDSQLGRGEPVEDAAQVISRMCDMVMIRTFEQTIVERFAANSRVPVINGLTNEYHPCQIMADIFTYIEHRGSIEGKTVAWIGDSNNVCNTWLQAGEVLGFKVHVATPPGYEVEPERAGLHSTEYFRQFSDPMEAARGADIVTTDVWTSMGFEAENDVRLRDFADYRVDAKMMRAADPNAIFLHCLPAHRGEEVTAEVIDGPQSFVWDEAENRMHVQKALMEYLLLGRVTLDIRSIRNGQVNRRTLLMFGFTEEQVAWFGMTFGVGAFMCYMLFIIGELAWKSKAGKVGTFVLFFVLAFGMLGFVAKAILTKYLEM